MKKTFAVNNVLNIGLTNKTSEMKRIVITKLNTGVVTTHNQEGEIKVKSPYNNHSDFNNPLIKMEVKKEYSKQIDDTLRSLFLSFQPN